MTMNRAIIIGYLGQDAELKYTQGGEAIVRMRIATTESWKDKHDKKQERTEWHTLVYWGKGAEAVHKYLIKGKLIAIEGKLQTREWEDKNGSKHYSTEVRVDSLRLLSSGGGNGGQRQQRQDSSDYTPPNGAEYGGDDIPFNRRLDV